MLSNIFYYVNTRALECVDTYDVCTHCALLTVGGRVAPFFRGRATAGAFPRYVLGRKKWTRVARGQDRSILLPLHIIAALHLEGAVQAAFHLVLVH